MRSRSGDLLRSLIDSGAMSADDLAREILSSRTEIDAFARGDSIMDLSRQLCLAKLAIERFPRFARTGRTLHAQVLAAAAVEAQHVAARRAAIAIHRAGALNLRRRAAPSAT